MSTGKRIRTLRAEKGWSQGDFVQELNRIGSVIRQSSMSQIENDINYPSVDLLVNIAKVLGTTTDYLLVVSDDPFPAQSTENQIVVDARDALERQVLEDIIETVRDLSLEDQQKALEFMRFIASGRNQRGGVAYRTEPDKSRMGNSE